MTSNCEIHFSYSTRHFDGHRFITFIQYKERNIWMVMMKSSTIPSNVNCFFTLPKFNEFKFFLYQNLIWFVDFCMGKSSLIQRKEQKDRKIACEQALSEGRKTIWWAKQANECKIKNSAGKASGAWPAPLALDHTWPPRTKTRPGACLQAKRKETVVSNHRVLLSGLLLFCFVLF